MIELIPEDDWKDAVQIIGWLYQYYNSEKKDDVFAALKKNVKITKENIHGILQKEIGIVFTHVLEDAGVYKCTTEGREAFMRFLETL